MSRSQTLIYCPSTACANPANKLGHDLCENCQTPLIYRYLWAIGADNPLIPPGVKLADRYQVIAPQIVLDTQPGLPPDIPPQLPDKMIPYLRLYPQRLHVPEVYGICQVGKEPSPEKDILLLENVPIDATGNLYPSLFEAWSGASPVRQVYWLWQILQLWQPLSEIQVAASLLVPDKIRVEGWRVRLLELETRAIASLQESQPTLIQLAECWKPWVAVAQISVADRLQDICQQMIAGVEYKAIASQLNQLLLSTASELPLRVQVAGATDTGPQREQNEDSCYPTAADQPDDKLNGYLTIVCDGIGGHEGGEVASQLAVQTLKLQICACLKEVALEPEPVSPELFKSQLEAILRVVNNVISARNDSQGRAERQRMGTTLVMALQLPQRLQTLAGWDGENAHELYLANIGDSRAYWLTANYCIQLTVDDDVAAREVRSGRSLYREALQRLDAGALTQALGTRDGEFIRPTIQRLIIEEDGLLLLCSDGLSDNNWVEQSWRAGAANVLKGESLESAARYWIDLANTKNGHDNTSVVLSYCRVSPEYPVPFTPIPVPEPVKSQSEPSPPVLAETILEPIPEPVLVGENPKRRRFKGLSVGLGLLVLLLGGGAVGLFALWQVNPKAFEQVCQQFPNSVKQLCPPAEPSQSPRTLPQL